MPPAGERRRFRAKSATSVRLRGRRRNAGVRRVARRRGGQIESNAIFGYISASKFRPDTCRYGRVFARRLS